MSKITFVIIIMFFLVQHRLKFVRTYNATTQQQPTELKFISIGNIHYTNVLFTLYAYT